MSNLGENPPSVHMLTAPQSHEVETSHFRRRTLSERRFVLPRRYVTALLLSVILVIEVVRRWSLNNLLFYTIFPDESEKTTEHPSIGNWTLTEIHNFGRFLSTLDVFMSILAGLLIYQFSSHKFLLLCVTASSILHVLLPTALSHHSIAFVLTVLIGQEALSAPIFAAVLCMWRDWAPPDERTWLVSISFLGITVEAVAAIILFALPLKNVTNLSTFVGISGLIWALLWYNIASSTPQSDPLITEKEYNYLDSKIPSDYQERTRIRDVPWKSIFKSIQVPILCLVFFKLGNSVKAMQVNGLLLIIFVTDLNNPFVMFIPFVVIFISFFYVSSYFMDFLLRRNRNKALMIRKIFLCLGFVLQSVFLLATVFLSSVLIRAALFIVAYSCLAFSIPGVLRLPLDLTPRYVPIIAGFAFSSYCLGTLCFQEFSQDYLNTDSLTPDVPLTIYESVISLTAAVAFGICGDTEEQSWSFLTSSQRRGNDYRSYPQPDDEDDVILVPETV